MSKKKIYLDNAATTALDPAVLEAMMPYFLDHFGNASSIHAFGRNTRAAVERARKTVANILNTSPSHIFFTSGGTESNNMALHGLVEATQAKYIITSTVEHHAVLHTVQHLAKSKELKIQHVALDDKGAVKIEHLEFLLQNFKPAVVSLMHGNNEIGNLLPLHQVANLCTYYNTPFHTDTVQTLGHYTFDLQQLSLSAMVGSAHKFHGPKGVGCIYISPEFKLPPFIIGGTQERNMRGGTENVPGIVGLAKALELSHTNLENDKHIISTLKNIFVNKMKTALPSCLFNGNSEDQTCSMYHVVNVRFPKTEKAEMLLFNFDIAGIAVSGGSACTSGAVAGSHVLETLYGPSDDTPSVRFSFSKHNTIEEIDYVIQCIKSWFTP